MAFIDPVFGIFEACDLNTSSYDLPSGRGLAGALYFR